MVRWGGGRCCCWHRRLRLRRRHWRELGRIVPVATFLSISFDSLASRCRIQGWRSLFWVSWEGGWSVRWQGVVWRRRRRHRQLQQGEKTCL